MQCGGIEIALRCEPECDRLNAFHIGDGGEFVVVAINDDMSIGLNEIKHLGFSFQNAVSINEVLQVAAPYIGHNHGVGACHLCQAVHFAKVADAHFQHRQLVIASQAENGDGQAEFVVEIAFGFECLIFPAQHTVGHLFGARFTHTAHDTHHRNVELL